MFIRLKKGKQERLLRKAIKKAGSYRQLSKLIKIPRSSLSEYVRERMIPEERLNKILKFLQIKNIENLILEKLTDNWKQIKGGKNCIVSKKEKGTFEKEMKRWQNYQAKKLKKWHKSMKKNNPERYYLLQYSRFKKIGGYKYKTIKGEKVRNSFEKETADILHRLGIKYEYEPLVNIGKNYFFPDFVIENRIIIECTMWKGEQKAYKLKEKINSLKRAYKVFVLIPKNLYSYYKILNNHLITGLDEFVPVAQTFKKES